MKNKALIFDLDGTLINTIGDISDAINEALKRIGLPLHYEVGEVTFMVGNGADTLMHRALGKYDNEGNFTALSKEYPPLYKDYQNRNSHPYEGMKETLIELKNQGIHLFVCTNKPNELAQIIIPKEFGDGLFDEVYGHKVGEPVKPDPHIVNHFLNSSGIGKKEAVFVGDSLPDLQTARNAGIKVIMCTYGYGKYTDEFLKECDYIINEPKGLLRIINEQEMD